MLGVAIPCYFGKYTSETQKPCPGQCWLLTLVVIVFPYTCYFKYRNTRVFADVIPLFSLF